MRNKILITLIFLIVATPLVAQKSDKAEQRIQSWYTNDFDIWMERMKDTVGIKGAIQLDSIVIKWNESRNFTDVLIVTTKFNPFWEQNNKLNKGTFIKYLKRMEQIPAKFVEEWQLLTGAGSVHSGVSLAAEEELFSKEKFNESAFQTFIKRFK